jgi:hypothetical protein
LLVARKQRATSKLASEQRCASVFPRVRAARQHKTATHAGRAWRVVVRRAWQSASRAAARRGSAWAQQRTPLRAAARGSASRQRARCGARARVSLEGRMSSCVAREASTAAAARVRAGSVTDYKLWRKLPARAWAGRRRHAQSECVPQCGALAEYCSPAHCTARDALAHIGFYSHCAQKYGFFSAKAGARRVGGAPSLLRTSVFGPRAVGARATAQKKRGAGSANTRAAGSGGARGGVQSWRRGGRFSFSRVLLLVRSSVPLLGE